jgi:hypothetical protein
MRSVGVRFSQRHRGTAGSGLPRVMAPGMCRYVRQGAFTVPRGEPEPTFRDPRCEARLTTAVRSSAADLETKGRSLEKLEQDLAGRAVGYRT